jgi:murein DD-endopeptidase MepM/ murein hydrolase activator NlpD
MAPVNRPPPGMETAPAPGPVAAPTSLPPATPAPAYTPAKPAPAEPRYEPPKPEYKVTVQGKVDETRGKSLPIKVGKGDTVNVISDRLATDSDELIKINKLKKPYELDLGQVIQIPTPKAYDVQAGDTLYSIGKRFGISADALSEINDLDPDAHLRAGHKIYLPSQVHDNGPLKTLVGATPPRRPHTRYEPIQGEAVPPPVEEEATPPTRTGAPPPVVNGPPVVEAGPAPSDSQVTAAGKGRFTWPVAGSTLSSFGPKAGGQRNDGLDIAAAMGAPVQAAAEGDVVYAGNQVPGFGNLVLIKHADGWVTAYAHLSRTEVKIRDHVTQGQEIGQVGVTGGVDEPQLHFEIRYAPTPRDKARPIDPGLVLPAR